MYGVKKLKPKKRDKELSKRRLMDAGLEVFSKYGYDAATTKMVATKAKLNEQLITRYFGGKSGLLLAILASFLEDDETEQTYPPPADSLEDEIRNGLLFRHARFLELQEFLRVFIPRTIIDSSIRDQVQQSILKRGSRILTARLFALQQQGLVRKDIDLDRISITVIGHSLFVSFLLRVGHQIRRCLPQRPD